MYKNTGRTDDRDSEKLLEIEFSKLKGWGNVNTGQNSIENLLNDLKPLYIKKSQTLTIFLVYYEDPKTEKFLPDIEGD